MSCELGTIGENNVFYVYLETVMILKLIIINISNKRGTVEAFKLDHYHNNELTVFTAMRCELTFLSKFCSPEAPGENSFLTEEQLE